jgi:hypothetical protein
VRNADTDANCHSEHTDANSNGDSNNPDSNTNGDNPAANSNGDSGDPDTKPECDGRPIPNGIAIGYTWADPGDQPLHADARADWR